MEKKSKKIWMTRKPWASSCMSLWATIALVLIGCSGSPGQGAGSGIGVTTTADDGFIEGVWVDQWLLNKAEDMELDSAWRSLRNFTHFGTYRNEKGEPSWSASVPDRSGTLTFKNGSWYDGQQELITFQFDKGDTLAKYHFTEGGYQEAGVGPIRTYQLIPRQRPEDTWISDDWIYKLYYFPGSYLVMTETESFEMGLSVDGDVLDMKGYSHYGLNIGNSLPLFGLESANGWKQYVIEGTKGGFLLFEVLNEKELDGYDNDIVKGPQVYRFISRSFHGKGHRGLNISQFVPCTVCNGEGKLVNPLPADWTPTEKELYGVAIDFWEQTTDFIFSEEMLTQYVVNGPEACHQRLVDAISGEAEKAGNGVASEDGIRAFGWRNRFEESAVEQVKVSAACPDRYPEPSMKELEEHAAWERKVFKCLDVVFDAGVPACIYVDRPIVHDPSTAIVKFRLYDVVDAEGVPHPVSAYCLYFSKVDGRWLFTMRRDR